MVIISPGVLSSFSPPLEMDKLVSWASEQAPPPQFALLCLVPCFKGLSFLQRKLSYKSAQAEGLPSVLLWLLKPKFPGSPKWEASASFPARSNHIASYFGFQFPLLLWICIFLWFLKLFYNISRCFMVGSHILLCQSQP